MAIPTPRRRVPRGNYPVGRPVAPPPGAAPGAVSQVTPRLSPTRRRIFRAPNLGLVGGAVGILSLLLAVALVVFSRPERRQISESVAPKESADTLLPRIDPFRDEPAVALEESKRPVLTPSFGTPPGPEGSPSEFRMRRRDRLSADELARLLLAVPEIDLDADSKTTATLLASASTDRSPFTHPILDPLLRRDDLHGLPVQMAFDCQLSKEPAQNLQVLSRKLRALIAASFPRDSIETRLDTNVLRQSLLNDYWQSESAVPAVVQMLQAEDRPVRLLLVELLSEVKGDAASAALVGRALFDLAADVREAAVLALRDRPAAEYRGFLLDGLRYPWAPVADHAAEALVALEDREALPALERLLSEPDPDRPMARQYLSADLAAQMNRKAAKPLPLPNLKLLELKTRQGGIRASVFLSDPYAADQYERVPGTPPERTPEVWVVRELVRTNHMRNCLLCHAPSQSKDDPVRGLVPSPGQPLPPPSSVPYYEGDKGQFVRADVTYLRQDFSVTQPVLRSAPWPAHQRYDYVVRTRYPRPDELATKSADGSPQRAAIRFAIRELQSKE